MKLINRLPRKRFVHSPYQLRLSDWRKVGKETLKAMGDKNLSVLSAGVAFFGTLSFFPLMVAMVSLAALVIRPGEIETIVQSINTYLPGDIASLVSAQLQNLINNPRTTIVASVVALVIAFYGISGAIENLIRATNTAYDVVETRSFIKMKLMSLLFTIGTLLTLTVMVPLMIITGGMLKYWGLPVWATWPVLTLRWVLLIVIIMVAVSMLYKYGPNRPRVKWHWVSWGGAIATILWLVVTGLFFVYARYFANFSDSYSLFAGIIVLMLWLNLSAMTFLIGAEVNHRLEQRTVHSTKKR